MATENLSPDVYKLSDYVLGVEKNFIDTKSEDTLSLGIFGYTNEIFSSMLQNTVVMASEFSNESIPTKAKFEKNIIAHALGLGITNINACPARMEVLLTFLEDDIINWANAKNNNGDELPWSFTFDKNNKIYFGDYEFHTDYDIIIKKVELTTTGIKKRFAYTAQYDPEDFAVKNPVSSITNPYLNAPVRMNMNGAMVIMVRCTIRQVEKETQYTKVLSDNDVSAKTITFEFEGQLAAFSLDVTEANETYHMVPVYEGLNVDTGGQLYFWYTYLDSNTIRIKFDRNSKIPEINAAVKINLQTTQGVKGNFTFVGTDYPEFVFESERLNYSNIVCQVIPTTNSCMYGTDKKTIEELKQVIPKEALSRGSITNTKDLENFFNELENENSKLYFYKKRDNALERLYYSYMIVKDELNIVPTNTVNLVINPDKLDTEEGSGKLVLKQNQIIILNPESEEARLLKSDEVIPDEDGTIYDGSFAYVLPYDFIISQSPLYGMYFMTTLHYKRALDFTYINESCLYQYIATNISADRNYIDDHNTYKFIIDLMQNIIGKVDDIDAPVYINTDGETISNVDVYMVIYDEDNQPLRWAKAEFIDYEPENGELKYEFSFTSEDRIDIYNRIRIDTGLYDIKSNNESYAHLKSNTTTKLFVVSNQATGSGLGIPDLSTIIPGLEGKSLSNSYTVMGGIDWFHDYSEIVNSTVTVEKTEEGSIKYHIEGVPVVKHGYFIDEDTVKKFYDELVNRKVYIDDAIQKLEDAFGMDFKFFNTYGPSKWFTWDNGVDTLDRVNISLFFKMKLKPNYDTNIVEDIKADIKDYVEDINDIKSIHIPNLITQITNTYRDYLEYFEFVSINGKHPGYQHIYKMDTPNGLFVPEFINIHTLPDGVPDITITMD